MSDSTKPSGDPLEKKLDLFGDVIGIASIVAAVALFLWMESQSSLPGTSAITSLILIASGAVAWLQFHAAGEVIRLLKRLNNLPYQGKISVFTVEGADESEVLVCSECGTELTQERGTCPKCGAPLEQS